MAVVIALYWRPGIEMALPLSKSARALGDQVSASSHRKSGAEPRRDVHPLVELGLGEARAQRRHGDARGRYSLAAHSLKLFTHAFAAV